MLVFTDVSVMHQYKIFSECFYDSREVVFRFDFQIGVQVLNFHAHLRGTY